MPGVAINSAVRSLVSVAPMVDVTDRHCRYFLRQIAPRVTLYTEMITARAVLHGDREYLLGFDPSEHPLVLQLAGHDPDELAAAARIGAGFGYDAINLNIGCPSERVQTGRFGACLMAEPDLVARCVSAMKESAGLPVTVKCRTGIDEHDSYPFLLDFVMRVARSGCDGFIVHARKAILHGLTPAENRCIPPLCYERVYRLKADCPDMHIVINGGIRDLQGIAAHLQAVDGVMLGRKALEDPCFLATIEAEVLGGAPGAADLDRQAIVRRMYEYAHRVAPSGVQLNHVARHMLGLFFGKPGARAWRRFMSEHACRADAGSEVLLDSISAFPDGSVP